MRLLRRTRRERGPGEAHVLALVLRHVGRPGGLDRADVVVAQPAALAERQAQGGELRLLPAHAHTEDEASARALIDGRRSLGRHQRVAVGQHDDAGSELDPARAAGEEREQRERIRPVTAVVLRGGRLGQDVVGNEDAVEPQLFRLQCERLGLGDRELPDRKDDSVVHAVLLWRTGSRAYLAGALTAKCRSAWSTSTSVVIASTIGTARGSTQGSWRPRPGMLVASWAALESGAA